MRKEQNSHKLQIRVNVALLKTALAIKVKQAHLPLCLFLHTSLGLQGNHYCDRSFILIQCTCQIILYTISISLENVHLELHQYRREASLGARHAKGFWSHIQHCKYRVMPSKPVGLLWIHNSQFTLKSTWLWALVSIIILASSLWIVLYESVCANSN